MTNTQEAFENTLHNICDNLRDDGIDADIGEYVNRIMQSRQAHNDAVIAELVEAFEIVKRQHIHALDAVIEHRATIAELVEALDMLLITKEYKDKQGKDAAYEAMRQAAWTNAENVSAKHKKGTAY